MPDGFTDDFKIIIDYVDFNFNATSEHSIINLD